MFMDDLLIQLLSIKGFPQVGPYEMQMSMAMLVNHRSNVLSFALP